MNQPMNVTTKSCAFVRGKATDSDIGGSLLLEDLKFVMTPTDEDERVEEIHYRTTYSNGKLYRMVSTSNEIQEFSDESRGSKYPCQ